MQIERNNHKNTTIDEIDVSLKELLNQWDISEENNKKLFNRIVGLQIRKWRLSQSSKFKVFSQSMLAKLINVSFQQIQKYEKGRNAVSLENLKLLSEKMNITVDYFWLPITNRNLTIQIKERS